MFIGVLGPLEVRDDAGAAVGVPGERLRALLTRLALAEGQPVGIDALIDAVWGDAPPAGAANALQSLVSRLRRLLPPDRLVSLPTGYRLSLVDGELDVARFGTLVGQARAGGDPALFEQALALWRGEPEISDPAAVARLVEQRLSAVEELLAAGGTIDDELVTLARQHPLRERLQGLRMRALAAAGRTAEALALFEEVRARLADELGVDPSPELRAAQLDVLRGGPRQAARTNVRAALTSFVGRDDELERLALLLDRSRLVTLVGPGGAGKTRLANRVVTDRAERDATADGAWIVELAGVTDAAEVPTAIITALGLHRSGLLAGVNPRPGGSSMTERLVDALQDKDLLVVLDNCEHLIDACARVADAIVGGCEGVRILATSREPLAIIGEVLCPVGPLPFPSSAAPFADAAPAPAVRLFVDRASAVRPGFVLDDGNIGAVVEICRRLDGMPLAIELACARLRTLPVHEIAARLGERFRLLTGGSRTALPRHRTLHAVVEWSWELLTAEERVVARRLAAFAGAIDPVSAVPVCGRDDVLDAIGSLVDKSFVQLVEDEPLRYRMLDTIRAFAADRLAESGEADAVRRRHATHFLDRAERATSALHGRDQLPALAWLRRESDNLTAAMSWAIDAGEAETALRLAVSMSWFWQLRGSHDEGRQWFATALALEGVPGLAPEVLAIAYSWVTMHNMAVDAFDEALAANAAARSAADRMPDEPQDPLYAMTNVAMHMYGHELAAASTLIEKMLSHDDPWVSAIAELTSAHAAEHFGDAARGATHFIRAWDKFSAVGDRWGMAMTGNSLGLVHTLAGDHARAVVVLGESAVLAEAIGADEDAARMYGWRGVVHLRARNLDAAAADLALGYQIAHSRRSRQSLAFVETGLAELARLRGAFDEAREHLAAALEDPRGMNGLPLQTQCVVLIALGRLEIDAGNLAAATERLDESLVVVMSTNDKPVIANSADTFAILAMASGDAATATDLLALAAAIRGTTDQGNPDVTATTSAARAALGPGAFEARYAAARSLPADDAVARLVDLRS